MGLRSILWARQAGVSAVRVAAEESTIDDVRITPDGTSFTLDGALGRARLTTPLLGRFQAENTVTALTMLDAAGAPWRVPLERAAAALNRVRLPGRFQRMGRWVFDVAHNPDGSPRASEQGTLVSAMSAGHACQRHEPRRRRLAHPVHPGKHKRDRIYASKRTIDAMT